MKTTYRILGKEEATHGCEHCNKPDIRTHVVLEPTAGGGLLRVGTTCAARLTGRRAASIRKEADGIQGAIDRERPYYERMAARLGEEVTLYWDPSRGLTPYGGNRGSYPVAAIVPPAAEAA